VGVDQGLYSSFSAFSPDATRLVTNPATGVLTLRDGATGASLGDIPTGAGRAAQPDFSPDGQKLVYVGYAGNQPVWELSGGSLEVLDAAGGGFGAPTTVVAAQGSENNYYPQFSPDGDWILFNRVPSGSSYNNPAAEIWVVRADGSQPPVPLDAANQSAGLTNSWPRWAPVVQDYQGGHLLWLTVSSQRAYGLELAAGTRPQLWMMGFDPARAAAGMDPSWPAFWLPFQDLSSDNHIAQWTTQIVTVP
jgi:WD40 repeat protein